MTQQEQRDHCADCPNNLTNQQAEKKLEDLLVKDPDGDWSIWDIYYSHESEFCNPCVHEEFEEDLNETSG